MLLCLSDVSNRQPIFNRAKAIRLIAKAHLQRENISNGLIESTNRRIPFLLSTLEALQTESSHLHNPKQSHFNSLHTF